MRPASISVPMNLLLAPDLTPTAKLIWMVAQLDQAVKQVNTLADRLDWMAIDPDAPAGPATIARRSGLTRPTVRQGLAQLAAAGWPVAFPTPAHPPASVKATTPATPPAGAAAITKTHVTMPIHLLAHRTVGAPAKLLYGFLQATPHEGRHTYAELSLLTGHCLKTVRRAVHELIQTGWLRVTQPNQRAPLQITLANPEAARAEAEVAPARLRIDLATYKGEAIMREFLTLLVDVTAFADDAAPGFLINPLSGQPLQLDRYYPPHVAFEFQGPQHDGPTDRFPSQDEFNERQARDLMKLGLCATQAITLILIYPEDLTLQGMQQKIGCHLPIRSLAGHGRLVAYLEAKSRRYREEAAQGGRPA